MQIFAFLLTKRKVQISHLAIWQICRIAADYSNVHFAATINAYIGQ